MFALALSHRLRHGNRIRFERFERLPLIGMSEEIPSSRSRARVLAVVDDKFKSSVASRGLSFEVF